MSIAISVEHLSKSYRLGSIGTGTLGQDVSRWWARVRHQPDPLAQIGHEHHARRVGDQFWALDDVSFDVQEGEVLGIIGRNGAGKSTLLKVLSQVTAPTSGRIRFRGRIASLLEVGTGFHPELTGSENIFLNGAILGMTKAEIRRKFDEIVAFSECEEFLDTPVKRYSSGMYVRLAFAVAAHLEPEILVIDEVLAVGDTQFQQKCLGKMQDVADRGRTVLFVSHNMTAVSSLCSRAVLLAAGAVVQHGTAPEVIAGYLRPFEHTERLQWEGPAGDDAAQVLRASVRGDDVLSLTTDRPITLTLDIAVRRPVTGLIVAWEIRNRREQLLAYSAADDDQPPPGTTTAPGLYRFTMTIPADTLASGSYVACLDLGIHNSRRLVPEQSVCLDLRVENVAGIGRRYPSGWTDVLRPCWPWEGRRS
jgi:lipopolysaccharide transport system ATP-binding protein